MFDLATVFSLIALILTLVTLVGGGVWAVGKINSTVNVLNVTLTGVKDELKEVRKWLSKVGAKTNEQDARIVRLETIEKTQAEV